MIYICDVSYLNDLKEYKAVYSRIPDFRREKADKFKFMKDRICSVGAWGLLQYALAQMGIDCDMGVSYNEQGKPYFTDRPDINFSLSHSGNIVMCAISENPVGCDVQQIGRNDKYIKRIADRFFGRCENEYLNSLAENEKDDAFYRIWTIKESYVKALGDGLSKDFSSFDVRLSKEGCMIEDDVFYCHEIDYDSDYKLAYCSLSKEADKVVKVDRL